MNKLSKLGLVAAMALAACATDPSTSTAPTPIDDFQALRGSDARDFKVPGDLVMVDRHELPGERVYERYQQMIGEAKVLGGQLTLHRNDRGESQVVVGAYHEDLSPSNKVILSENDAEIIASNALADANEFKAELMIHPETGAYYYNVEARGEAIRSYFWIDAESGEIQNQYNGLTSQCSSIPGGYDYLGNEVSLAGMTTGDASTGYTLSSGRQETRDLGSWKKPFYGTGDQDADGCFEDAGRSSPGQGALVSAHLNVATTDAYYLDRGFDMRATLEALTGATSLVVWAHKDKDYVNAYWDGQKMVFGDGNGTTFRELVALDIAAHEFTHGVTEFHSNLIYQNESGALNESFSDIMGAVLEFQEEGAAGDWLMGEDATIDGTGLRDMANPELKGDPGHYCDRYTGTSDNGGVHSNSGISNRAFYLLATDIGLSAATDIFYDGFTSLSSTSGFMQARLATEAVAPAELLVNVGAAWDAVGVADGVDCGPVAPDCSADGACNADCAAGADPDCTTAPDCSADGSCNADCAAGADPDCSGGTCELAGQTCSADSDCCSNNCKGKPGQKTCK